MTFLLERCLCWTLEKKWVFPSKLLALVCKKNARIVFELEKRGETNLSFILWPHKRQVCLQLLENAIKTEDFSLVSFVCERHQFDDWQEALRLALKYKKPGMAKIFIEFGADKTEFIKEFLETGSSDLLIELLSDKEIETSVWDSLYGTQKKIYRHQE